MRLVGEDEQEVKLARPVWLSGLERVHWEHTSALTERAGHWHWSYDHQPLPLH